jgi:SAM-dependent methyltransferase
VLAITRLTRKLGRSNFCVICVNFLEGNHDGVVTTRRRSIGGAMTSSYVHGSTDDHEVERLVVLARFVAGFALERFDAPAGARVLDLGTGVGAMAAELARRYPGIALTGVDISEAQLAVAQAKNPVAAYVHADASKHPFPDASFDRVHAHGGWCEQG